jgi:hypothetical protein
MCGILEEDPAEPRDTLPIQECFTFEMGFAAARRVEHRCALRYSRLPGSIPGSIAVMVSGWFALDKEKRVAK